MVCARMSRRYSAILTTPLPYCPICNPQLPPHLQVVVKCWVVWGRYEHCISRVCNAMKQEVDH
jgi:hypothetical protein